MARTTKAEAMDALAVEREAAMRVGAVPVPNPTGETLVFDPTVPGMWRKAKPEEAADHDAHLDDDLVAARKEFKDAPVETDVTP